MFPLCAVRRVGTCWRLCSFVVLRPRLRLVSFVAPSWQEGGDMYVLRESCPYLFAFSFLFTCFSEWPYSTSRPGGNQVDGLPPV